MQDLKVSKLKSKTKTQQSLIVNRNGLRLDGFADTLLEINEGGTF